MDYQTKKLLQALTTEFYAKVAASFSETRSAPWQGWSRVVDEICSRRFAKPLSVLDVGCGNLRFEKYLLSRGVDFEAVCVDNCEALMAKGLAHGEKVLSSKRAAFAGEEVLDGESVTEGTLESQVELRECDVMGWLLDAETNMPGFSQAGEAFDFICAFGFLHHVPSMERRVALLQALGALLKPDGLLAVSFWQFAKDDRLLNRAEATTEIARERFGDLVLEPGDYLLGWKNASDVFRYCHSFSEKEITSLSEALSPRLREVTRFCADGKSGDLNCYVVWQCSEG